MIPSGSLVLSHANSSRHLSKFTCNLPITYDFTRENWYLKLDWLSFVRKPDDAKISLLLNDSYYFAVICDLVDFQTLDNRRARILSICDPGLSSPANLLVSNVVPIRKMFSDTVTFEFCLLNHSATTMGITDEQILQLQKVHLCLSLYRSYTD